MQGLVTLLRLEKQKKMYAITRHEKVGVGSNFLGCYKCGDVTTWLFLDHGGEVTDSRKKQWTFALKS
jgi:Fe2+ or Zn2+ uptake regulation protein